MSGHTPGPWTKYAGAIRDSDRGHVAAVAHRAEHDANVKLIAAAPDLLKAAVAIDMAITALPLKLCTDIANSPGVIEAVRMLRAAIRAAEGQL